MVRNTNVGLGRGVRMSEKHQLPAIGVDHRLIKRITEEGVGSKGKLSLISQHCLLGLCKIGGVGGRGYFCF